MRDSWPWKISSDARGGILLAALIVTLLATTLVLGASYEVGVRLEARARLRQAMLALSCTQAGLENGARLASVEGALQGQLTSPVWIENKPIGAGLVTVEASDPGDGLLGANGAAGSSTADTVRLTARATVRGVSRGLQADFIPLPHWTLRNVAYSRTTISLMGIALEGRLRANEDVIDGGVLDVHGDITTVAGEQVSASLTDEDTDVFFVADTLGPPEVDFTWFREAGEEISLPSMNLLANVVITAQSNPYGSPSPAGIYWIDAGGEDVYFGNLVIEASLAVIDCDDLFIGGGGGTTDYYHASPDPARLPAMVVQGNVEMSIEGGKSWPVMIDGETETVSSGLRGVFFCTGNFQGPQMGASQSIRVTGALLAARLDLVGPGTRIRHDPDLNLLPLAEMTRPGLRLLAGTTEEL
ncbi:MAG: hypothetical protein KAY32_00195 [Candidatus Eisenbacteria sp.]|nr:hypothetical protein [Candidatus Eisenbacteria bacterium]